MSELGTRLILSKLSAHELCSLAARALYQLCTERKGIEGWTDTQDMALAVLRDLQRGDWLSAASPKPLIVPARFASGADKGSPTGIAFALYAICEKKINTAELVDTLSGPTIHSVLRERIQQRLTRAGIHQGRVTPYIEDLIVSLKAIDINVETKGLGARRPIYHNGEDAAVIAVYEDKIVLRDERCSLSPLYEATFAFINSQYERTVIDFVRSIREVIEADSNAEEQQPANSEEEQVSTTKSEPMPVPPEEPRGIIAQAVEDIEAASLRTARSQLVKATLEPFIALLHRNLAPGDENMRTRLAAFFETDIGKAMFQGFLALALGAMPVALRMHGAVPTIVRELRVEAMHGAGDVLADLVMAPLRQTVCTYLQGTPPEQVLLAAPQAKDNVAQLGSLLRVPVAPATSTDAEPIKR